MKMKKLIFRTQLMNSNLIVVAKVVNSLIKLQRNIKFVKLGQATWNKWLGLNMSQLLDACLPNSTDSLIMQLHNYVMDSEIFIKNICINISQSNNGAILIPHFQIYAMADDIYHIYTFRKEGHKYTYTHKTDKNPPNPHQIKYNNKRNNYIKSKLTFHVNRI